MQTNRLNLTIDAWKIVERDFDPARVLSSESLFALGNGVMGGRANFEEPYSGPTLQGNYIGGVYYPDKTRVGWWKNGYPEYFAKVLNAAFWIGVEVQVDGVWRSLRLSPLTAEDHVKWDFPPEEYGPNSGPSGIVKWGGGEQRYLCRIAAYYQTPLEPGRYRIVFPQMEHQNVAALAAEFEVV